MDRPRNRKDSGDFRPLAVAGLLLVGAVVSAYALELEPGFYRNAPTGLNALTAGYAYSGGNVLTDDSSVPIEDAKAHIHIAAVGYAYYFGLFGKMARVDALVPVAWGHYEGTLNGQLLTRDPHGLADPRFRFTLNLTGSPALDREAYKSYRQDTIWGLSLMMGAPFGQYDSSRLVNLGANRWSFRPETGVSHAWRQWCMEAAAGAWIFTNNEDYYGGSTLSQAPIEYVKGNLIYDFSRRLWASVNFGYATGGQTKVDDIERADYQNSQRFGGTLSLPLSLRDKVTLAYDKGLVTRVGSDMQTVWIYYTFLW